MRTSWFGSAALALFMVAASSEANACGFAVGAGMAPFKYPYLSEERVLIVWNGQTKVEHFVREIRFEQANQTFGFIVPTPSKPEVSAVESSPFAALETNYPFERPNTGMGWGGLGLGSVGGFGHGAGAARSVEVLSVKRVGKFKAYTLAANDAATFTKWLGDNDFATTPELDKWLAHYVQLGFHYVAFRYDAKSDDTPGMTSQTVRISFESELPYYPYFEPRPPAKQDPRRLTTWFVSQHGMKPIATMTREGKPELVQPWHAGAEHEPALEDLSKALGELGPILPIDKPQLQVQVFRDRKVSREGFHDVVLVPAAPPAPDAKLDAVTESKHHAMLAWLDPTLAGAKPIPTAAPKSASAPEPVPTPRAAGCSTAPDSAGSLVVPAVLGLALLARSRRRTAALVVSCVALVGCNKSLSNALPAPSASASAKTVSAPKPPVDPERKEREALLLAAFTGLLPAQMKTEAGPHYDPPSAGYLAGKGRIVKILEKSTEVSGKLPPEVIKRIVRANFPRFRACYELGLKANPKLAGTVQLKWKIDNSGAVDTASLGTGTLGDAAVRTCMLGVLETLSFPEPESGTVSVSQTYEFTTN